MAAHYNNTTYGSGQTTSTPPPNRSRFSYESSYSSYSPSELPSPSPPAIKPRIRGESVSSQLSNTSDTEKQVYSIQSSPSAWKSAFYNHIADKPLPPLPHERYSSSSSTNPRGKGMGDLAKPLPVMPINTLEYEKMLEEVQDERRMAPHGRWDARQVAELSGNNEGTWWI